MYEIFYRLNTGGVNLTPQEIRTSLYHSDFYAMIAKANLDDRWRKLTTPDPDLRMRDMEFLLRGFAILLDADNYQESMIRFLNAFSEKARKYNPKDISYLESLFQTFLQKCAHLSPDVFELQSGRFSASIYEAIFTAACEKAYREKNFNVKDIDAKKLAILKKDSKFLEASRYRTAATENVITRLARAREILFG